MSFSIEHKLKRIFKIPNFRAAVPENEAPWDLCQEFKKTGFYSIVGNKSFIIRTKTNFNYIDEPREIFAIGPEDENGNYPVIQICLSTDGDLSIFRDYMACQGKKALATIGNWDLSIEEVYDNAVSITNHLIDEAYNLVIKKPFSAQFENRIFMDDTRRAKLNWLSHQPSFPREIKSGYAPSLKQSNFYAYIGAEPYTAEFELSVINKEVPYKLTLIGSAEVGTVIAEITFASDGKVHSLVEEVYSGLENEVFKKEVHIMPHNLQFYQQLADNIADRAINDLIFRSHILRRDARADIAI